MKIIITGGHLAPALAIIEEIKRIKPEIDIIFVGRKYALDSEKTISLEYKEITKRKIEFISFITGRLSRILTLKSIRSFFRIPIGFFNAFSIIKNIKPDIVFSFGGYLSFPIVFWAWFFKIKIFTHEQTIKPGLANRIVSLFSYKNFIAFSESARYFPKNKTVLIGNPIKKSIFKIIKKPFIIKKDRPVIYITGGSLGSHSINEHIKKIISKLLNDYIVIHQTGDTKEYHDYEDLLELKNKLPKKLSERYFLVKHFYDDEMGYIYSITDLVVGRSGANTFFELISLKKPAIFIPLPWSSGKEQQHHAEIFARYSTGEIFHQVEMSEKLIRIINKMIKNIDYYKKNFSLLSNYYKKDVSKYIVEEIFR